VLESEGSEVESRNKYQVVFFKDNVEEVVRLNNTVSGKYSLQIDKQ